MNPKPVKEMTIKGLQSKATQHFDQAGSLSSRMMICRPGSQSRMEFAAAILVERIEFGSALAELARRARAAEKAQPVPVHTGNPGHTSRNESSPLNQAGEDGNR